jgi:hypothetical protein
LQRETYDWLVTRTRPTTIHGSNLSEQDWPQAEKHYKHAVNEDNKMHYERMRVAARHPGYRNYQ